MNDDYRSDTEPITPAIVEKVAAAKGVDPLELDPLYEVVDPDALNALCRDGLDGRIEFRYADCTVRVTVDTAVEITVKRHLAEAGSSSATEGGNSSS